MMGIIWGKRIGKVWGGIPRFVQKSTPPRPPGASPGPPGASPGPPGASRGLPGAFPGLPGPSVHMVSMLVRNWRNEPKNDLKMEKCAKSAFFFASKQSSKTRKWLFFDVFSRFSPYESRCYFCLIFENRTFGEFFEVFMEIFENLIF